MTRVFADTGYWIAILNKRDGLHEKARQITAELKPVEIFTTEMVLAEFLNEFASWGLQVRAAAAQMVDSLRDRADTIIVEQAHAQFVAALRIYKTYDDKRWSLTDCASFQVMKEKDLTAAFTHDRHFEQMGFSALLRQPS